MRTIWHALAWKEWHEHKWKLAAVTTILIGCIAVSFKAADSQRFDLFMLAILLPMIPLSMLMAASSATSERSRNTLPFLLSLPISPRRVAMTRLISGLSTCLIPVLIVMGLIFIWIVGCDWLGSDYRVPQVKQVMSWPLNFANWFLATFTFVAIWVLSIFLWTAAAGVNRADEVSAIAVALAVVVGIWGVAVAIMLFHRQHPELLTGDLATKLEALGLAIIPGGFARVRWGADVGIWTLLSALLLFVAMHFGLATWFVRRFGATTQSSIRSPRSAVAKSPQLNWLDRPRRSWFTAIAWKQFRESGPLVLVGLAGVALLVIAALLGTRAAKLPSSDQARAVLSTAFFGSLYLGGFTTLVVGIGVFLRDLSPEINTFWRSRPISPRAWYWVKFATGALLIAVPFQLPMLALPFVMSTDLKMADQAGGPGTVLKIQLIGLLAYLAVYAVAIATTCLLRSAVYASVLTIALFYGGAVAIFGVAYLLQKLLHIDGLVDKLGELESLPVWIAALLVATAAATLLGYQALRSDWGRKSRG